MDDIIALDLRLAHIGINGTDENNAGMIAEELGLLLNLPVNKGNSSIFAGQVIEVMKKPFHGRNGHIAIAVEDIDRALPVLETRGYEFDYETLKTGSGGEKKAVYFKKEIGGFALHLIKG